jgi:hypothetical protein
VDSLQAQGRYVGPISLLGKRADRDAPKKRERRKLLQRWSGKSRVQSLRPMTEVILPQRAPGVHVNPAVVGFESAGERRAPPDISPESMTVVRGRDLIPMLVIRREAGTGVG